MKWPADRISSSSPKSFGNFEESVRLFGHDPDVIHLEVGRPDFDTPEHIKAATIGALKAGKVHYGEFAGETDLREAIAHEVSTRNGIAATSANVIVTNGLTQASFAVMFAAIDPGEEVILLEPYYPQVINKIQMAGGTVVTVPLDRSRDFAIDPVAIEAAITPRTRMICIVNPNNPTGRVYSRTELQALADIAIRHDLLVSSDEVYERIVFDGAEHISIASLPGMAERTFSLFALTKAYAMDGWRIGYIVADKAFIPGLLKVTMNEVSHVNTFIQAGAVAALTGDQTAAREMLEEDHRRMRMVCDRLNRMPGVSCKMPQSTIYLYPDIRGTGYSSADLARLLLRDTKVSVESGAFYGPSGEGHLRICIGAEPLDRLAEAMDRIERFLAHLLQPQTKEA